MSQLEKKVGNKFSTRYRVKEKSSTNIYDIVELREKNRIKRFLRHQRRLENLFKISLTDSDSSAIL